MAVQQFGGEAQFAADLADLVLVKRFQRFHDAAGLDERLNAGHAVVMRLDDGGLFGAAGFDGVGVDGALAEDPVLVHQAARLDDALLHAHEFLADDVALLFGIGDAAQRAQELLFGVLHREARHAPDKIGFSLAHQAGIDVHAANAVMAQRARRQGERHAGIHPAADEEEDVAIAHALADLLLEHGHPVAGIPIFPAAADAEEKVGEVFLAAGRMDHLGMKLQAVEFSLGGRNGRNGARLGAAGG